MKIAAVVLIALLLNLVYPSPALGGTNLEKEVRFAQKVKTELAKLGSGPNARVELKLRDKTKLRGYISEVGDESFVVVDDKTGSAETVTYPQVNKSKAITSRLAGRYVSESAFLSAYCCSSLRT
jgi:hypothetical protein